MKQTMTILMLLLAVTLSIPAAMAEKGSDGDNSDLEDFEDSDDNSSSSLDDSINATDDSSDSSDDLNESSSDDSEDDTEDSCPSNGNGDGCDDLEESSDDSDDESEMETSDDSEMETNDDSSDSEETATARQIEDMNNQHGSEMRLLQLKHEIERRVVFADRVIDYLDNRTNSTNQTTLDELQNIRDDLEALIPEVDAAINSSNNDTRVQTFLDIKQEAKNLVKKFRETARPLLNQNDIDGLGKIFRELDKQSFQDIQKRIKSERQELNAERVATLMREMGIQAQDLAEKVRSGEITPEQARDQLKTRFNELSRDQKEKTAQKFAENAAKLRVERAAKIEKAREDFERRKAELERRLQERREKIQNEFEARQEQLRQRMEEQKMREERTETGLSDEARVRA